MGHRLTADSVRLVGIEYESCEKCDHEITVLRVELDHCPGMIVDANIGGAVFAIPFMDAGGCPDFRTLALCDDCQREPHMPPESALHRAEPDEAPDPVVDWFGEQSPGSAVDDGNEAPSEGQTENEKPNLD